MTQLGKQLDASLVKKEKKNENMSTLSGFFSWGDNKNSWLTLSAPVCQTGCEECKIDLLLFKDSCAKYSVIVSTRDGSIGRVNRSAWILLLSLEFVMEMLGQWLTFKLSHVHAVQGDVQPRLIKLILNTIPCVCWHVLGWYTEPNGWRDGSAEYHLSYRIALWEEVSYQWRSSSSLLGIRTVM